MTIRLLLFAAILSLILHQRLAPNAAGLNRRIGQVFRSTDFVFGPLLGFIRGKVPPLLIGPGLSLEPSHLTLIVALLTVLTLL
jgi:hypothetical protein